MTIDFISIDFYTPLYYHVLLFVMLLTFTHTQVSGYNNKETLIYVKFAGFVFFGFVLLYMGLRPIHGVFVDMTTYANSFERFAEGDTISFGSDIVFNGFMKVSSQIITVQFFFLVCSFIYVIPLYLISKKWFKQYWFYAFLMLVGSLSFWAYGTNGIRNGMASSLFLLAISREKRVWQVVWLFVAIGFHKTMLLPVLGFVFTWFYNKAKVFLWFWILTIPLSLTLPGFWESLFASMVDDDRASYLTAKAEEGMFSSTGFRWDFLLYSATGVLAGGYYLFKMNLKDKLYTQIFNTYLFANAFWILVIRANFSNRFAYLSWFMLALVIIYPWLRYHFKKKQFLKLGWIMLTYYSFTYLMVIILNK